MAINDGGPAFPNVPEGAGDKWADWDKGMTLRDYFAIHASQQDVDCAIEDLGRSGGLNDCRTGVERIIRARLHVADAMLKARATGAQR